MQRTATGVQSLGRPRSSRYSPTMLPERRKIVDLWKRGGAVALATLVRVEGSSYRRPGARLLIAHDGTYAGAISGGCLEAEVLRKAQWLVRRGATVQRYSTLFDDTAEIPYGLGCGGTVDVLLEPAGSLEFLALLQAMEASLRGHGRRVITQLPEAGGPLRRRITDAQGERVFGSESGVVDLSKPHFDEAIQPPQRLFICGAGDDAQPVVRLASLLGWSVAVVDGRAQWARPERFPEAERVMVAQDVHHVRVATDDAVVVMTHSYEQDRAWLAALLPQCPRYLGLLGARHRSALLMSETAALLGWDLQRTCEQVFAPIGLDLGGDGAEAIALAVVSEVQAHLEQRLPVVRRLTPVTIAEQIAKGGASLYLQAQCAL